MFRSSLTSVWGAESKREQKWSTPFLCFISLRVSRILYNDLLFVSFLLTERCWWSQRGRRGVLLVLLRPQWGFCFSPEKNRSPFFLKTAIAMAMAMVRTRERDLPQSYGRWWRHTERLCIERESDRYSTHNRERSSSQTLFFKGSLISKTEGNKEEKPIGRAVSAREG